MDRQGRLRRAPENFLDPKQIAEVQAGRRDFLRGAFAAAVAGTWAPASAGATGGEGDPAILNLPEHSKGLGQPVVARAYGQPSQFEKNLQRRESPGLTRVGGSSVSFAPLQGLFGIITPNGLHFERHHQGWWDIDPHQHRLMVMGMVPLLAKSAPVLDAAMPKAIRTLPSSSLSRFAQPAAHEGGP